MKDQRGPQRERWREDQEERGLYLSGSNFSGSVQKFGSWWMRWIGSWTVTPLGIVTPLISMVFSATREVLQRTQHSYVALGLSLMQAVLPSTHVPTLVVIIQLV